MIVFQPTPPTKSTKALKRKLRNSYNQRCKTPQNNPDKKEMVISIGGRINKTKQATGTEDNKHPRDLCDLQSRPHCLKNYKYREYPPGYNQAPQITDSCKIHLKYKKGAYNNNNAQNILTAQLQILKS